LKELEKSNGKLTEMSKNSKSASQFYDGEEFNCMQCGKKILSYDDGQWMTPIDEETGNEIDEETEVYCNKCVEEGNLNLFS
jgi:DNA-directed RNA polymerase subunit RPC12/RpoP